MPIRLIPESKAIVSIATLSFLYQVSENSIIFYLQNIAAWAYYTHKAVLEHNEDRTSPYYLLSAELCNKVYLFLLRHQLAAGRVQTRIQGDLLSAFLILQHMPFRDIVEDIYLFAQQRYHKNALIRIGEGLFQVGADARTVGELTARLGEAYDSSMQMGSIERLFIGTLHRL